jgi:mRNA interferase MazF
MTGYKRGDVVVVRYPNSDLLTYKKRPALVVQADDLDTKIDQTVVALITTNLQRTGPSRVRFDRDSSEGQGMGLLGDSVVVADNIATVLHREIDRVIGTCPRMKDVDAALRKTLNL